MILDESKLSTELNLALQTPYDERVNSMDLNVGYNEEFKEWELIIRYTGNLEHISQLVGFTYTELLNGYAVIRIPSEKIDALISVPDIIFVEKPKQLYFEENNLNVMQEKDVTGNVDPYRTGKINGFAQSCMELVQTGELNLKGEGVLAGVIDSGIDYRHSAFIREDGSSRILSLWDQGLSGNPPDGTSIGTEYTRQDIEHALNSTENNVELLSADNSGHGTGVSGVIASCVPDADLIVVKLNEDDNGGFPRTTALMMAVDYTVRTAIRYKRPLAINLSFGNNYGNHSGNSILEDYLDSLSGIARISIAVGMGNDGNTGRHIRLQLERGINELVDFQVSPYTNAINLQAWHSFADELDISLVTPRGEVLGPFSQYQEVMSYNLRDMNISVINGYPTPINRNQEIYMSIIPTESYIQTGIWSVMIKPRNITDGRLDMWLPVAASTSADVRFLTPSPDTSMTIPASASTVISVGAYDPVTLSYAPFSGRGYTVDGVIKPDIAAPGVDIDVPLPGGGIAYVSGTSYATPFVTSGAVMLLQWGITDGNDPYLYGEKLKSYLIRGAKPLPGYAVWPNELLGWGALCVFDSLPG